MKSSLFTPPGLKPYKIEYLSTSNVLDLIKEGKFEELPVDIIICHFDNVLKFYNWFQNKKQQEIQLQSRYVQNVFEESKQFEDGMMNDQSIEEILNFITK